MKAYTFHCTSLLCQLYFGHIVKYSHDDYLVTNDRFSFHCGREWRNVSVPQFKLLVYLITVGCKLTATL